MSDGHCTEGVRCVCGGDLPSVRAGCHYWRASAPKQAQETSLPPQGAASLLPASGTKEGEALIDSALSARDYPANPRAAARAAWEAARFLLAASPAPAPQEPAAWRYRYRRGGAWIVCAEKPIYALQPGFDVEPLYASPAPGELAQQAPSSDASPLEWPGAVPFLTMVQSVVAPDADPWGDEFLAWYEPSKWMGEHRACAVWLGAKLRPN